MHYAARPALTLLWLCWSWLVVGGWVLVPGAERSNPTGEQV